MLTKNGMDAGRSVAQICALLSRAGAKLIIWTDKPGN
jgi:hypothetical protein